MVNAPTPLHGVRRVVPQQVVGQAGPAQRGRVVVVPGAAAFVAPASPSTHSLVVEHLRSGGIGRELVERAAELIGSPDSATPTMALLAGDVDGVHLLVHGLEVQILDVDGYEGIIVGAHGDPVVRTFSALRSLSVRLRGEFYSEVDPLDQIDLGVIAASGMSISFDGACEPPAFEMPSSPAPSPPAPSAPAAPSKPPPAPAPPSVTDSPSSPVPPSVTDSPSSLVPPSPVPLSQLGGRVTARPVVPGLMCSRGHFNDPATHFCARCGIAMHQASIVLVEQERPPLGVLLFDNGEAFEVADDLCVGRNPLGDSLVTSGLARALMPSGDVSGLSRVHATVHLEGWQVTVRDRGSLNGTFLWDRQGQRWNRLAPDQATTIRAGDMIGFGRRTATFETSIHTR